MNAQDIFVIVAILGSLSNPQFFFVFSHRTIVLAIAFSFSIFLICSKVYSCSAEENYIVMGKRKSFSLRNILDDVSECEDSESELDDLYDPKLDSDSFFSDEYESELSESIISDSPPSKQGRTPFRTTEAPQEVDNDVEMNSSYKRKMIETVTWHWTLHKANSLLWTLVALLESAY